MNSNSGTKFKIDLTDQEIGEAIAQYIGAHKLGRRFYPYRVKSCSIKMPKSVEFELEEIPKDGEYLHFSA